MLLNTFLHLPGVGERREIMIWRAGVETWEDYLRFPAPRGIGERLKRKHHGILEELMEALEKERWDRFRGILPSQYRWRLFRPLGEGAAFLDIETDGLGPGAQITVLGVYRRGEYTPLIKGYNLSRENVRRVLEGSTMLVTFNGSSFDLPIIEREYPGALPPVPHLDLLHTSRRAGLRGGLKVVERALGLEREIEVADVDGEMAVKLWRMWVRDGSRSALRLLIKYNREDTQNLVPLAKKLYKHLRVKTYLSLASEAHEL